jgi:hypothetical protein
MTTAGNSLLIADLRGSLALDCEPGPAVHGEVWLKRHEDLLIVYWEAWEAPMVYWDGWEASYDEDGGPQRHLRYIDRSGIALVAGARGDRRWQALCVIPRDRLPPGVADLAAAYADPQQHELLLTRALTAVNDNLYVTLGRGRFSLRAHRWREREA